MLRFDRPLGAEWHKIRPFHWWPFHHDLPTCHRRYLNTISPSCLPCSASVWTDCTFCRSCCCFCVYGIGSGKKPWLRTKNKRACGKCERANKSRANRALPLAFTSRFSRFNSREGLCFPPEVRSWFRYLHFPWHGGVFRSCTRKANDIGMHGVCMYALACAAATLGRLFFVA